MTATNDLEDGVLTGNCSGTGNTAASQVSSMKPLPFFLGLLSGLIALSVLGANVHHDGLAATFIRYHKLMNAESNYFPTVREVKAIVELAPPPAIHVIVGGSSVFFGEGQSEGVLWTRKLQEILGPQFRVINLAHRSGSATDFGSVAAEMLLQQGRPVIFFGDANHVGYANRLEDSFYRHMLFDAWHHGLLLPWTPRDEYLRNAVWSTDSGLRNAALQEWFNYLLNFNDLWNFVSYNFVGLSWNPLLAILSFSPRRDLSDPEPPPEVYRDIRYRDNLVAVLTLSRRDMVDMTRRMLENMRLTEQLVPPRLRNITLVAIDLVSPYYMDRLGPQARAALLDQAVDHARAMKASGFREVIVPAMDFISDDYVDRVHLSSSGGEKVAKSAAPVIRQIAADLGYLK